MKLNSDILYDFLKETMEVQCYGESAGTLNMPRWSMIWD